MEIDILSIQAFSAVMATISKYTHSPSPEIQASAKLVQEVLHWYSDFIGKVANGELGDDPQAIPELKKITLATALIISQLRDKASSQYRSALDHTGLAIIKVMRDLCAGKQTVSPTQLSQEIVKLNNELFPDDFGLFPKADQAEAKARVLKYRGLIPQAIQVWSSKWSYKEVLNELSNLQTSELDAMLSFNLRKVQIKEAHLPEFQHYHVDALRFMLENMKYTPEESLHYLKAIRSPDDFEGLVNKFYASYTPTVGDMLREELQAKLNEIEKEKPLSPKV